MSVELTYEGTSRTVDVDGERMHYHDVGEGPALVFLHGGGPGVSGWSNFKYNLPELSQHFRCVVIDQPGFGRSHQPEFKEPFFDYSARAVAGTLRAIGIERAHFLGNSLGGGTTVRLALDEPAMVERLVLMGPGGLAFNVFYPGLTEGLAAVRDFYRGEGPTREKMAEFIKIMVFDSRWATDEFVEERFALANDPETMEGTKHALEAVRSKEFWAGGELWRDLERVRAKTLLVWGRDDKTMPMDGAFFALKRLPDVQLHVFGRCGHWVQMEHTEAFDRLVLDFLTVG
ncbi:MAG: alpha/beta hydrolase fold protein [Actinomycetia bacterium]|nr:alpha/beta hydrolase fold protein [Actinomycetes bacterium]